MWPFSKKEERTIEDPRDNADDVLLQALLGKTSITKEEALNIPSVKSCIQFVADAVSMLPIKLYAESDDATSEIKGDIRVKLLNDETGDTLDSVQFWRALVADYYLGKGGYAYINRSRGKVKALHYVDEEYISINKKCGPYF